MRHAGRCGVRCGIASVGALLVLLLLLVGGCTLLNQPPVASITVDIVSGPSPLTVTFRAHNSNDPDGQIVSFFWDFGDGETTSGITVSHTFYATEAPQSYTVTLTVTDDEGAEGQAQQTIEARLDEEPDGPGQGGGLPVARFDVAPFIGVAPVAVTFNGSDSLAGTGEIIAYNWKFGDGETATGPEVTHTYAPEQTEEYTVTLYVWNSAEVVDTEQKTVVVIVPENDTGDDGPDADASVSDPLLIYESDNRPEVPSLFEVTFDPRSSVSAAGHVLKYYAWDFGDGAVQVEMTDLPVTHRYELRAPTRTYIATLTVYDDQGEQDAVQINVTLIDD